MSIIFTLLRVYELVLLARIVLSWIRPVPQNVLVEWVYRLTEPVLEPIRRVLPTGGMGIDFSPIVVFVIIDVLKRAVFGPMLF